MASTERPDAHTQRYDRQLRLWASSGQASLESASVLLIGCTPTGTSTLKNLVLPGIGSFTILDPRKTLDIDRGANFFLDPEAKNGASWRADDAVRLLTELNPNVKGFARHEDVRELLPHDPSFFTAFSLIIASNQPDDVLYALSELCWNPAGASSSSSTAASLPLLSVRTSGLVGEAAFQIKEAGIIETHPESLVSLRLTAPWPELEKYALSVHVQPEDSMERSHIPFIVLLMRTLHEWKEQHGGALPDPAVDRKSFTDKVWACKHPGEVDSENVEEAVAALNSHVWRPIRQLKEKNAAGEAGVPTEIQQLFKDAACEKINRNSTNFWLLARALRSFVHAKPTASPPGGGGYLPQPGSIPDMKALSATYIQIQKLYYEKAEADLAAFRQHLDVALKKAGITAPISDHEVRTFVKHAAFLVVICGKKLKEQHDSPNAIDSFSAYNPDIQPPTLPHHIAFLAASIFYNQHSRFPGASAAFSRAVTSSADANADGDDEEEDIEADSDELKAIARTLAPKYGADIANEDIMELIDNAAEEMARAGHSSLPSTSALMGGIVAQEVIKLVTRQYVPANNTVVYNGIQQAVGVFKL
ncbi:hypothetical protein K437DRAFT_258206 [Tilletiaria anomala UBC 951]|uniref:NEDD8-activating enzyme E1 regulatory subunit n=1 Tax=Tilletiaria anomala (strain ATCC 24038 / CBS 436.72 / UBC 951) TaxID=1037660 RepID=A0A066VSR0_TILAU|nr:uncharacterized protein K437DRAFT_258206 [Tilletiaria anomala UBC 951]KDN41610.1 hypothetical protein K437DRAFT_258206 [Tilletiaria anomala UBC 951]